MKTVLDQHQSLDQALTEYAEASSGEPASKTRGLLKHINSSEFVVGIMMALPAINLLENLNKAVQSRSFTISGAVAAMEVTYRGLEALRTEEAFNELFASCASRCEELGMEAPKLPRARNNRPKRFEAGETPNYQWGSAEEYFRVQYLKFLDTAMAHLKRRYEQPGIQTYIQLENILVKPVARSEVIDAVKQYPELDEDVLHTQLAMVKQMITEPLTVDVIVAKFVSMDPVVRRLFPAVETLVRLLLTIPCSSAEAERSFSGLRRLKTYLRNSMTQARLNHLAILHVHQEMTDAIDVVAIAKDFVGKSDTQLITFGQ